MLFIILGNAALGFVLGWIGRSYYQVVIDEWLEEQKFEEIRKHEGEKF